ncbi:hypothetical protein TELCIR_00606 [Teladorsagia circumcincta]|uniref:Uncharacterized protein n=1 Tax=Teladorsagia circumcincta TaxID=45464 RepID=A0A2G9V478_TELCI|nr:hypothetical protein TELCIR_00606 [Teladorsagia circumcincta]
MNDRAGLYPPNRTADPGTSCNGLEDNSALLEKNDMVIVRECTVINYFFDYFYCVPFFFVTAMATPLRGCEKNSTRCFQVFKVSLSTLQEEDLSRNLKPVKKYGNNVFAPRGNSPKLTEKVIESMPANADPRVKENILNNNYFLKRVDADDGSIFTDDLQDLLPQNIQHVQSNPSVSIEDSLPVYLIILLIVVGILVGILGTCSVLVFVDYKNNPKFDTSGVVTYTRRRNFEKLYVDAKQRERLERQRRQAALSRTPLPVPGRVSRTSRESELMRSSREATESLRADRKNSY